MNDPAGQAAFKPTVPATGWRKGLQALRTASDLFVFAALGFRRERAGRSMWERRKREGNPVPSPAGGSPECQAAPPAPAESRDDTAPGAQTPPRSGRADSAAPTSRRAPDDDDLGGES